jgi:hypothetical protein
MRNTSDADVTNTEHFALPSKATRREFLRRVGVAVAAATGTLRGLCAESLPTWPGPSIDTHIHVYDPTRPQGVPWPPKNIEVL